MSFYGLADGASFNSLFGNTNMSANNSGFSMLSDYASIRNGSYHKLLKSYYNDPKNKTVSDLVSSRSTATSKDEAKKLTKIQESADDLKDAANKLTNVGKDSVFKKVTKENEDGTAVTDYDKDAIYKSVNSFVESYNSLLKETEEAESGSIVRTMENLMRSTVANEKVLSKIGISINSDGSLKLDKDSFMASDMETVKSIFNGSGSYGYNVSAKAAMVDSQAANEAARANTYGKNGAYNYNYTSGSSYSSFI